MPAPSFFSFFVIHLSHLFNLPIQKFSYFDIFIPFFKYVGNISLWWQIIHKNLKSVKDTDHGIFGFILHVYTQSLQTPKHSNIQRQDIFHPREKNMKYEIWSLENIELLAHFWSSITISYTHILTISQYALEIFI